MKDVMACCILRLMLKVSSSRDDFSPEELIDDFVYFDDSVLTRHRTWCNTVPSDGAILYQVMGLIQLVTSSINPRSVFQ